MIDLQTVYLRGTTYLRMPLFGMIPVVTLFVKGAGAVVKTEGNVETTDERILKSLDFLLPAFCKSKNVINFMYRKIGIYS